MQEIRFETFDLNLLRVFDAIITERSVVKAGDQLGITSSAVSHALSRLRYLFNDELFIRGAHGMHPTHRAAEIGEQIHEILVQLRLVLAPTDFVPEQSGHQFTIACGPYGSAVFLPHLIERLQTVAPNVRLIVKTYSNDVADELDSGHIDLAIGQFGRVPDRFEVQPLFKDRLVWVVSADSAKEWDTMSLEQLASIPHILVTPSAGSLQGAESIVRRGLETKVIYPSQTVLEQVLKKKGLKRQCALTVPGAVVAFAVLRMAQMAALIPQRHTTIMNQDTNFKVFEPPHPAPTIEFSAVSHKELGTQLPLEWFRNLVGEVAQMLMA